MVPFNGDVSHLIFKFRSSAFSNGETGPSQDREIILPNEISKASAIVPCQLINVSAGSLHRKRPRSFPHNLTYHTPTVIWVKLATPRQVLKKFPITDRRC